MENDVHGFTGNVSQVVFDILKGSSLVLLSTLWTNEGNIGKKDA
jgi:hypothetical protein